MHFDYIFHWWIYIEICFEYCFKRSLEKNTADAFDIATVLIVRDIVPSHAETDYWDSVWKELNYWMTTFAFMAILKVALTMCNARMTVLKKIIWVFNRIFGYLYNFKFLVGKVSNKISSVSPFFHMRTIQRYTMISIFLVHEFLEWLWISLGIYKRDRAFVNSSCLSKQTL